MKLSRCSVLEMGLNFNTGPYGEAPLKIITMKIVYFAVYKEPKIGSGQKFA